MSEAPGKDPEDAGQGAVGVDGVPPGVPRWVKVSALVVGVLALVVLLAVLVLGGDHGPGRHMSG